MSKIALIVAVARNNVIGLGNTIPWYCPADLQYFKRTTMGAPVLMGRKTYESLQIKPLPGRQNIIVTRDENFQADSCDVVNSIDAGLELAKNEKRVFIIGGEEIYRQVLDRADELYITFVDAEVEGDRYFPEILLENWKLIQEESHLSDKKNIYNLTYKVFVRNQ